MQLRSTPPVWLTVILLHVIIIIIVTVTLATTIHDNDTDNDDNGATNWNNIQPLLWMAPFFSSGGYCSEAISFVLSLKRAGIQHISIRQHGDGVSEKFVNGMNHDVREQLFEMTVDPVPRHGIVICHSEPGAWYPARYQTTKCPPDPSLRDTGAITVIGRTMFETDRIPNGWAQRLNNMDSVWVPTSFHERVFAAGGVRRELLVVMPEPVDVDFYDPDIVITPYPYPRVHDGPRSRHGLPPREPSFKFLSIFKWEERKGWRFLLEAYLTEFIDHNCVTRMHHGDTNNDNNGNNNNNDNDDNDVALYILTNHYHSGGDFGEMIQTFVDQQLHFTPHQRKCLPKIALLPSGIPDRDMPAVYASADVFVLPSRGEGWGRPHVEAMSMGLPIISTHWSGPSEYMTHDNSYPLNHDGFDTIADGAFQGHEWARPSVTHLRQLMRHVTVHRDEAKQKGHQARIDMMTKYCPSCVAKLVARELSRYGAIDTTHTHHDITEL